MGTLSSEKEKEISGKVKASMYILIPAVSVGMISMLLLFFGSGDGFDALRFELGRLWSNITSETTNSNTETLSVRKKVPNKTTTDDLLNPDFLQNQIKSTKSILNEAGKRRQSAKIAVTGDATPKRFDVSANAVMDMNQVNAALKFTEFPRLVERLNSNSLLPIPDKKKVSRFSIGVSMFPAYTYRLLAYDQTNLGTRQEGKNIYGFHQTEQYREDHDRAVLNFGASADLYFYLNDRLTLQSGIGIQTFGEKVRVLRSQDLESHNGISPVALGMDQRMVYYAPESRPEENKSIPFINNYSFVQIPLYVNYTIIQAKKYATDLQAGAGLNYLIAADAVIYDFDTDLYHWTNLASHPHFRRLNAQTSIGIRWRSYFTESAEVFINPQAHCLVQDLFQEEYTIKQHPYAFGMRFGLRLHL